uniref:E3 ubiquitin ligase RNF4 n=1 Tax=Zeugodacus cucurbitae TaxID=28588 RepID=A0A0A1XLS8_ZEUCU
MSNYTKWLDISPNGGDLDELIQDTSLLIASVNNMLDQTQSTPHGTTTSLGRRSYNSSDSSGILGGAHSNSSSPKSPKTPRLSLPARATVPTPSSREIDREVNRIDRFCEMLEHNLRTVASEQDQLIGRRLGAMSPTSPRRGPLISARGRRTNRVRAPTPDEVIDLSDSMYFPPLPPPAHLLNVSDDVILVTPNDEEVVDLCTPNFRRNNARSRNSINSRRPANATEDNITRRRLTASRRLGSISGDRASTRRSISSTSLQNGGSSSGSSISKTTSTTNIGCYADKTKENALSPGAQAENSNTVESERIPCMCAVCMESYVNNQPTSTKCGHVFCAKCIREALRLTRKCPMCNTKITPSMLFRIYI